MARSTSFSDTFRGNPLRPKHGQISKDKKYYWDNKTKTWKKVLPKPTKVTENPNKFFGDADYGSGGSKEVKKTPKKTTKKEPEKKTENETSKSNGNKLKVNNKKDKGISKEDAAKKRWIEKTRRSGAAKGGFTGDERYALHQKHQAWKAARKAGTLGDWEEKYHPGRGRYKNKNKAKIETPKTEPKKNKLTIKEQHKSKLDQQQNETAKIMQNDSRYKGPKYKKKNKGGK